MDCRGNMGRNLDKNKAEKEIIKNEVLFRPNGGHYRIYLQKCPSQVFPWDGQIFFPFYFSGDKENHDPERTPGHPAGE